MYSVIVTHTYNVIYAEREIERDGGGGGGGRDSMGTVWGDNFERIFPGKQSYGCRFGS